MTGDRWIVVPNWDKFQHYTDRVPPWIKVYTELNSKPEWLELTLAQRGLLVTLWCEYVRANCRLAASRVRAITGLRNVYQSLKPLSDAGFIELVASKPLAQRREEKNKKERTTNTRSVENPKAKKPAEPRTNAAAYRNRDQRQKADRLEQERELRPHRTLRSPAQHPQG